VAVPWALILKQPDLGTAMIFVPMALTMLYVAGVSLKALGTLLGTGALAIAFVVGALFLPEKMGWSEARQSQIMRGIGVSHYQRDRLVVFFRPDSDPLGAGWNKRQSEIAVGSGGGWGKGFLNGTQNILRFLPRSVAPTDFIFCVIAEEKGFLGSFVVLSLFAVLVGSAMCTGLQAHDKMGRLLCAGVAAMLFAHVFVNISMTVGLLPITGLPLPLLSYGGSFMMVVMSALGMVQSVHIRSRPSDEAFEQGGLWRSG
jgi:rod shape determining protein RodA